MEMKNAVDRVARKVIEWAMRPRIQDTLVRVVNCLYLAAITKVKVCSICLEIGSNVAIHQGSVLSILLFNIVVITGVAMESMLCNIMHTDDVVLITETVKEQKNNFKPGRLCLTVRV